MRDILLFCGQSNMQGQSETPGRSDPVPGAAEYLLVSDSERPLCDPVGENLRPDGSEGFPLTVETSIPEWLRHHTLGAACYGNATLVPAFCEAYIGQTGREVLAVSAAKGSTQVHDWLPGTEGYALLVRKAASAIAYAKAHGGVGRILLAWLQGESDAIFRVTTEQYAERLSALAHALQKELGLERFGIIRVGRFTKDGRDLAIIEAQERLCRDDDFFVMLTRRATELNEVPECMNPHIGGHFGAYGLSVLGEEAGRALADA